MKLYLLRPASGLPEVNPWEPWYDKSFGHVVRAETEAEARQMANDKGGDEKRGEKNPWLDPLFSTCVELLPRG